MTSSDPPTPPAPSSAVDEGEASSASLWAGTKWALRSRPFVMLLLVLGVGTGVYLSLITLLSQIACTRSYSDDFIGVCITAGTFAGLFGAVFIGFYGI